MSTEHSITRIGLFGIGLESYWSQFPGLRNRLEKYLARIQSGLSADGTEVVNAGLVDSIERANAAADCFATSDVRLLFLYVSTYALSSTVLPVVQTSKGAGHRAEPAARAGHRLRMVQRAGRPRRDDRRVAGVLPGLRRAGDRQRVQPGAGSHSTRSPGRWTIPRHGKRSTTGSLPRGWPAMLASTAWASWGTTTTGCSTSTPTRRKYQPTSGPYRASGDGSTARSAQEGDRAGGGSQRRRDHEGVRSPPRVPGNGNNPRSTYGMRSGPPCHGETTRRACILL